MGGGEGEEGGAQNGGGREVQVEGEGDVRREWLARVGERVRVQRSHSFSLLLFPFSSFRGERSASWGKGARGRRGTMNAFAGDCVPMSGPGSLALHGIDVLAIHADRYRYHVVLHLATTLRM